MVNVEMRYIITYSELFKCDNVSEEEISKIIQNINYKKYIVVIARLSSIMDSFLRGEKAGQMVYEQIKAIYRIKKESSGQIINDNYYSFGMLLSPQGLMSGYKWLIARGKDNVLYKIDEAIIMDDIIVAIDLMLMISDYLPKKEVENHKVEFCNAALYLGSEKVVKYELARSYNFFVFGSSNFCNYISNAFLDKYGLTINDYLVNSFLFLEFAFKTEKFCDSPIGTSIEDYDTWFIGKSYEKYLKMMGRTTNEIKQKMNQKIHKVWDFEEMFLYPLLMIDNIALPYNYRTLSFVWFEGLYWRIRNCFDSNDKKFFRDFGRPFEQYVEQLCIAVTNKNTSYEFIREHQFHIKKGQEPRSSDGYIIKDDNLLIIECKAKAPLMKTISGYDLASIKEEIIDLIVKPVNQAEQRYLQMIKYDNDFIEKISGINNIYILSVSLEKIQPVIENYKFADKYLRDGGEYIVVKKKKIDPQITEEKIHAYYNFNIYDFEKLCILLENNINVFDVLNKYSELGIQPFDNYINCLGYQQLTSEFIEQYMNDGFDKIWEKAFDKKRIQ